MSLLTLSRNTHGDCDPDDDLVSPQHNRGTVESSNHGCSPQRAEIGTSEASNPEEIRAAEKMTRQLATSHYENFLVASVLLPRQMRQPFYNVYAYCRTADDAADESASPEEALRKLDRLEQELDRAFAGCPNDPLFVALRKTVDEFDLEKQPFADLLDAFRQDQHKTRYASFDELLDYCRRSANPVGRIVLQLGDSLDDRNIEQSDMICSGLQLANFWQDVARDFAIGRVYLPEDSRNQFGVDEQMLAGTSTPDALRELLASECERAESMLREGLPLADRVAPWLRRDVRLFAHGGLETLAAIRRIKYDVLRRRPTVSKWRQAGLVAKAMIGRL